MSRPNNLLNQRYERLLVIERSENDKFGKTRWLCQCDCGNQITVNGGSLLRGLTKSCGCYKKEQSHINNSTFINEIGNTYGKLTVLEQDTTIDIDGRAYWKCQCECGNIRSVQGKNLRNGSTLSCGCLKKSNGEFAVEKLLKDNNINFCYNFFVQYNTNFYYFDFAIIIDNQVKYFIEYDGSQHFRETDNPHWDSLERTQYRDQQKNEYCKINNIPLIRIPYTHYEKLNIKDLLLDETIFLLESQD